MAEQVGEKEPSAAVPVTERFEDSSSSPAKVKAKVYLLLGSDRPLHLLLGGGKCADILLWRDKRVSGGVLGIATLIWILFELIEYRLLTFVCHVLILGCGSIFLWSNASTFIRKSPPQFPVIVIPEDITLGVASALRVEINRALSTLRDIASGKELTKFLAVIAGLWVASIVGGCCDFLTLLYISFVLLHTVPVLYEKYADQIDPLAEKSLIEFKKQYAVFDAKVLGQIPVGQVKGKKLA